MSVEPQTVFTLANEMRHLLEQEKLRILTRFEPPKAYEDFGPQYNTLGYRVDIDRRCLEILKGEDVAHEVSIEIVGTYDNDSGTFLWPWDNSSIPDSLYKEVSAAVQACPELAEIKDEGRMEMRDPFAELMARWIVHRLGWFGVFAADYPGQPTVFVAIPELKPRMGSWCTLCFRDHNEVSMFPIAEELGLCESCVGVLTDIYLSSAEESEQSLEEYLATEKYSDIQHDFTPPCIHCNSRNHLVAGAHASICGACYQKAKDYLAKEKK